MERKKFRNPEILVYNRRGEFKLIKKLSEEDFPESQVSVDESGNIFYIHN